MVTKQHAPLLFQCCCSETGPQKTHKASRNCCVQWGDRTHNVQLSVLRHVCSIHYRHWSKKHDFNEGAKTALMNWLPTRTGVDFITCVKFELCPGSFDVHSCCFNVDALGTGKRMEPTETMASPRSGHYGDVIMSAMASQITGLTIVYSTVYSGADQRKHQCSASLAFAWIWSEFIVSGRMFNCGTKYCWFHWSVSSGVVAWSEVSLAIATLMLLCSVGFR